MALASGVGQAFLSLDVNRAILPGSFVSCAARLPPLDEVIVILALVLRSQEGDAHTNDAMNSARVFISILRSRVRPRQYDFGNSTRLTSGVIVG